MITIRKRTKKEIVIIKEFLEDYNCNTDDDYYVIERKIMEDLE